MNIIYLAINLSIWYGSGGWILFVLKSIWYIDSSCFWTGPTQCWAEERFWCKREAPLYPALQNIHPMEQISSSNAVLELLLFVLCSDQDFLSRGNKDLSDGWHAQWGCFAAILYFPSYFVSLLLFCLFSLSLLSSLSSPPLPSPTSLPVSYTHLTLPTIYSV